VARVAGRGLTPRRQRNTCGWATARAPLRAGRPPPTARAASALTSREHTTRCRHTCVRANSMLKCGLTAARAEHLYLVCRQMECSSVNASRDHQQVRLQECHRAHTRTRAPKCEPGRDRLANSTHAYLARAGHSLNGCPQIMMGIANHHRGVCLVWITASQQQQRVPNRPATSRRPRVHHVHGCHRRLSECPRRIAIAGSTRTANPAPQGTHCGEMMAP
jgi:hypothetical protein